MKMNFKTEATTQRDGSLQSVTIRSDKIETREQAEAIAALFPKYVKMYVAHVSCIYSNDDPWGRTPPHYFSVNMRVEFVADKVNGGYNEAGTKRYFAALRTIGRNAMTHTYETPFSNAVPTEAAFHSMLKEESC